MRVLIVKLLLLVMIVGHATSAASGQSAGGMTGRSRAAPGGGAQGKRPNIIVILADDMGYSDLGSYGGEILTPNLDRLAREGARFTDFYNTPRCCPTRAALLTGLYPQQTGVGWLVDQPVQPGGYTRRLNDDCLTVAEVLRGTGYHTLMSRKWHVGEEQGSRPEDRGFDRSRSSTPSVTSSACSVHTRSTKA